MRSSLRQVHVAFLGLVLGATFADAAAITLPPGLSPGATYRLVFVTAGTRDALSTNIADYNSFVTTQANLNADLLALGTTWKAIGSTATVTAASNIGGVNASDIYNLFGELVATSTADLFDGPSSTPYATRRMRSRCWQPSACGQVHQPPEAARTC